jgi:hypothetical protein
VTDESLLREPSVEERMLLDVVMDDYINRQDWPNFQYVEAVLFQRHGLDAQPILATCPRVSVRGGPGRYGWLRTSSSMYGQPQPSDNVALSISGMSRTTRKHPDITGFIATLRYLCDRQRTFTPSPSEVQTILVTSDEIREALTLGDGVAQWAPLPENLMRIAKLIPQEPSTWNCVVEDRDGGAFKIDVAPFVRPYYGVANVDDYVQRLAAEIGPSEHSTVPLYPSGLALPEAIDFLNAVWWVHARAPLIRVRRAEAAARLALGSSTAEEFESQLSSLCLLLDGLQLPGMSSGKLSDLDAYLAERLDGGAFERVHEAIDTLRALFTIRAWRQHAADERRWREAARRLDVALPTPYWGDAWQRVHLATVSALAIIREEVDGLPEPGSIESQPDAP